MLTFVLNQETCVSVSTCRTSPRSAVLISGSSVVLKGTGVILTKVRTRGSGYLHSITPGLSSVSLQNTTSWGPGSFLEAARKEDLTMISKYLHLNLSVIKIQGLWCASLEDIKMRENIW